MVMMTLNQLIAIMNFTDEEYSKHKNIGINIDIIWVSPDLFHLYRW